MKIYFSFFICAFFMVQQVMAQNDYKLGILSQLNSDVSLQKNYKLNAKLETRQIFYQGQTNEKMLFGYDYERSDLELVLSKKINSLNAVGLGYLIRLKDGEATHRMIQQYSIIQNINKVRLGHRFRTDQTFSAHSAPRFRIRYRISTDKSLQGQSIDPKEFYLKFSSEILGTLQKKTFDTEIRALTSLGYYINDSNKVEAGIDYRMEEVTQKTSTHLGWLNIGWYYSF